MTNNTVAGLGARYLSAVLIVSKDPERLVKFYRDVLGVPLEEEQHGDTAKHYGCELGDLHFAIHPAENFPDSGLTAGSIKLAFEIFDMAGFVKRLEEHGITPLYPPRPLFGESLITAVKDPDGNLVELTQLSGDWFEHLEQRKKKGMDIVQEWRSRLK